MKNLEVLEAKIMSHEKAAQFLGFMREEGQKVVFTNGCFDLLHRGHVDYLNRAADLGDILVIGLNSDDSVSRLKGPNRPLQNVESRKYLMAALSCVDVVVVFDQDTPESLIEALQPDVLVKGGDYTLDTIVGANQVIERGGEVKVIPFVEGYSTTAIEKKVLKNHP